jgi:aryl-alcohol dehydrogenase-like predicted oxidoreductase
MKYTRLGASGAQVSKIALGTMNFGPVIGRDDSFEILDLAVENGITFIDTADVYGGAPWGDKPGQTESLVGEWLGERGNRDSLVIATKTFGTMGTGPNDRGLSAVHIRASVEASLQRLGTDRIDLMQMHHIDRDVPIDEILDAFTTLREQGKILYLGSSNFAGWNVAQYQEHSRAHRQLGLVTEQSVYSLAERTVELEVIPAAQHYGLGLLPWSPLAGGQLAGVLAKSDRSRSQNLDHLGDRRPKIEQYETYAAHIGVDPAELGLAWLLHQSVVTAPIVGPRTVAQLRGAIAALDVQLDAGQLAALDRIWPGPGGQAPEAYSW